MRRKACAKPPLKGRSAPLSFHAVQAVTDLLGLLFLQGIYKQEPLRIVFPTYQILQ